MPSWVPSSRVYAKADTHLRILCYKIPMQQPVKCALLGAGLFARDSWVPLFRQSKEVAVLTAVWSRSEAASQGLLPSIQEFSPGARAFHGEDQLDQLLSSPDFDAVVLVLPVQVILQVAAKALKAGKHVLQEKPVGPTISEVSTALKTYRNAGDMPLWAVAENYRSEAVFREAAELVSQLGTVIKIDLHSSMPMNNQNKYYASAWRRDADGCPGGFVTDAGVHYIAGLRLLTRAAGWGDATTACAHARSVDPGLPPPDTVVSCLSYSNGSAATVSITFASTNSRFSLSVVGTEGSLEISRGGWGAPRVGYTLSFKTKQHSEAHFKQFLFTGLADELSAFAEQVQARKSGRQPAPDASFRTSVEEGARDLATIDALLRSQGTVVTVAVI